MLRLFKCYAKAAGLFVLRAFVDLEDSVDSQEEAIKELRKTDFGGVLLLLFRSSPKGHTVTELRQDQAMTQDLTPLGDSLRIRLGWSGAGS